MWYISSWWDSTMIYTFLHKCWVTLNQGKKKKKVEKKKGKMVYPKLTSKLLYISYYN